MLFRDVVGHEALKSSMRQQIREGRIPHAHLFVGNEGSGGIALALAYTRYTCCPNRTEDDSCGTCDVCRKFDSLQYPDLHFSFPMASLGTKTEDNYCDQVLPEWRSYLLNNPYPTFEGWFNHLSPSTRDLAIFVAESGKIARKLSLRSYEGREKFQIIWLPERMRIDTANKLLKTLEEPPEGTVFILVAEAAETILTTITSRTQLTRIPEIDETSMANALIEQFNLDAGTAQNVTRFAQGNLNRAIELINDTGGHLEFLENFKNWMRSCYKRDVKGIDRVTTILHKQGTRKQVEFLKYALHFTRQCIVSNYGLHELASFTVEEAAFAGKFARFIHHGNVVTITGLLEESIADLNQNINVKIVMMDLSLRMNAELHREQ